MMTMTVTSLGRVADLTSYEDSHATSGQSKRPAWSVSYPGGAHNSLNSLIQLHLLQDTANQRYCGHTDAHTHTPIITERRARGLGN